MTTVAPLAFLDIGFGEMLVVGIVALLLFGGRLPDVMRTLGASYRSFRRGWEDLSRQAMRPDLIGQPPYRPTPLPPQATPSTPASAPPTAGTTSPAAPPAPAAATPAPVTPPRPRPPVGLDDAPLV